PGVWKIQINQEVRKNIRPDEAIFSQRAFLIDHIHETIFKNQAADLQLFGKSEEAAGWAFVADTADVHVGDLGDSRPLGDLRIDQNAERPRIEEKLGGGIVDPDLQAVTTKVFGIKEQGFKFNFRRQGFGGQLARVLRLVFL